MKCEWFIPFAMERQQKKKLSNQKKMEWKNNSWDEKWITKKKISVANCIETVKIEVKYSFSDVFITEINGIFGEFQITFKTLK